MAQYVALAVALLALIVACYGTFTSRYQIAATATNDVFRVDTKTGSIVYYERRPYSDKLEEKARLAE
jgi:hypothetical protein